MKRTIRRKIMKISLILFPLFLVFGLLAALPPAASAQGFMKNPFEGDPQAIEEGKLLFARKCIFCHGSDGAKGPNLFDDKWYWGGSDKAVYTMITMGRQFTTMGAFYTVLNGDQIWKIMAYIRSENQMLYSAKKEE